MFGYVIINSETLKIYIGKTTRLDLNKYLHEKIWCAQKAKYKGRSHLYTAMQRYPSTTWSIHSLIQLKNQNELNQWELMMIKATASQNPEVGYNILNGGGGLTGWHHTAETRAKISATKQAKGFTPAQVAANQDPARNAKISASVQKRIATGMYHTPETRAKIGASHIGLRPSAETRAKQSISAIKRGGWPCSPETRAKIGKANAARFHPGHPLSPETRAKISATKRRKAAVLYLHAENKD